MSDSILNISRLLEMLTLYFNQNNAINEKVDSLLFSNLDAESKHVTPEVAGKRTEITPKPIHSASKRIERKLQINDGG